MRRLPSGVSVVSAQTSDGQRYAMTASSVTSVSDQPASLLVCVNRNTRICPILVLGQRFAINILSKHHQEISILCATGDQGEKRFNLGRWLLAPDKTPYLEDAEAVFECEVDLVQPYGTHNIVVGRIIAVRVASSGPAPLVYLDGNYRNLSL
ncbi:flavin reductase family protein [Saccharophagus sp. K07]|uniref:flavin reductase family protein n=1 Tax=Saccharophagus sp. K07 TaxID=2283636 RepID=UPI001CA3165A|nr:flavin reductase family protein [Saccharophagus sp. K07]